MKRLTYALCIGLLWASAGLASTDIATQLRPAGELLAKGEYEQAFNAYQALAVSQKNPLAQLTLALFYDNGWGRPVDPIKACQWYEKAAQAEALPVAGDAYGRCLAAGTLGDPDFPQAMNWYQKSADMGHHYSLCHLGDLYIAGNGAPQDAARGAALCEQSARQGSVPAMLHTARLYLDREDIRDPTRALQLYTVAASFESPEAQFQLGVMLRDGTGAEQDLLTARSWFEKAARQGYVPAYYETAALYFNAPTDPETGLWYEADLARAFLWLSATLQRSEDDVQRLQVETMLEEVNSVMPKTWKAELDAKVSAHMKTFSEGEH